MDSIVVASSNRHKLHEISHILKIAVLGIDPKVKETGKTFEANAIIKAKAISKRFNRLALADDSGLMVDFLDGKPGIKSARYAIPSTPQNLCTKLLKAMAKTKNRKAQFVSVIALSYPNGKIKTFKGIVKGKIAYEMRGENGFGYDQVFIPSGYKKTFGEMSPAFKNRISHRTRALKKANYFLKS